MIFAIYASLIVQLQSNLINGAKKLYFLSVQNSFYSQSDFHCVQNFSNAIKVKEHLINDYPKPVINLINKSKSVNNLNNLNNIIMQDENDNSKGHGSNDVIQVEAGVPKGKNKKVTRRKKPDQNKSDKLNENKNNYSNTNGKNPLEAEEKDKSSLGIVIWNIHGLKKEKIEIFKHKSEPTIKKIFDENELICITETWRDKYDPDILDWDDDFSEYSKIASRHCKSGRASGGTTIFIKNETREHGNIVYQDSYHAWYKLEKSLFPSLGKTFYICFLYIPPNSSTWFRSENSYNYDKLMLDIAKYESMGGEVIIIGDMNARIAEEVDFVENTDENAQDDYLPIPDEFEHDNSCGVKKRKALDNKEVSGHAKELINLCRQTGFKIVNGRLGHDQDLGDFTCHTPAGSSTVDYCLARENNFDFIENFYIGDINTISDHSYLQLRLKINIQCKDKNVDKVKSVSLSKQSNSQNNQETSFDDLKDNYNCKYIPCEDYRQKIKECLNSIEMKNELENLRSRITIDNISQADTIALLRNICIKLSDNSLRKIKFANSNDSYKGKNFQEWYDEDCKQAKKEVNKYRKLYQEALRNKLSQTETKLRKEHFLKQSTLLIRSREKRRECIGKGKGKL